MIELIIGLKGSGKTKTLIDKVNAASNVSKGNVVCVEFGKKLTFNVNSNVRLIDVLDYNVKNGESLYGFICGIFSSNYDITEIYIDSALKMCEDKVADFEEFISKLAKCAEKYDIKCFITSSIANEDLPETLKKYVVCAETL
ncbi:MAG: hypothetical protein E7614_00345 [Ruminococcaceae bacterium]|nr:hypothetical protein [Oscillospiraceae bacterium]